MTGAAVLCGLGTALPPHPVTNADLEALLDTSDAWIRSRTGIGQRYWTDGATTGDLATAAADRALKSAGTGAVDLVVLATTTPDHPCPATAPDVAARLGLGPVPAFDLAAVCSGFVYGLATAAGFLGAGLAGSALVIGAETYSTILDPADRGTRVIFGDGAGAAVLRAGRPDEPGALRGFDLGTDGAQRDLIVVPGGGSRARAGRDQGAAEARSYFTMQGKAVFREAVLRMGASVKAVLARAAWDPGSISRLVAHQANERILRAVADETGVPRDRVVVDLDRVGNTSAASIPLALSRALSAGRLAAGDRVVLTAFGGGLAWGSTALVWPSVIEG